MKTIFSLFASLLLLPLTTSAGVDVKIIFDDSSSMSGQRCIQANQAVIDVITQMEKSSDVAQFDSFEVIRINDFKSNRLFKDLTKSKSLIQLKADAGSGLNIPCTGSTPLSKAIQYHNNKLATSEWPNNTLYLIFTDGANDSGEATLTQALQSTLMSEVKSSINVYFFTIEMNTDFVSQLNQKIPSNPELGRNFEAIDLTSSDQLTLALQSSLQNHVNSELIRKLRMTLKNIDEIDSLVSKAQQSLSNTKKQISQNPPQDITQLLQELENLKLELNKAILTNEDKIVEVVDINFNKYIQFAKKYNSVPKELNYYQNKIKISIESFKKQKSKVDSIKDSATSVLAYLLDLEQNNKEEFKKIYSENSSAVESLKSKAKAVVAKSQLLEQEYAAIELVVENVNKRLVKINNSNKIFQQMFARLLADIQNKYGDDVYKKILSQYGRKGYSVLENGEIVYYGTHVWGGGSGSGASVQTKITLRNKGTIINLGGGSGGLTAGTFINDGLIINAVKSDVDSEGNTTYTVFLNNGEVVNIPNDSLHFSNLPYNWVAYNLGYLVFNKDLSEVYFVPQDVVDAVASTPKGWERVKATGKLLGAGAVSILAVTGSAILDSASYARNKATKNQDVNFRALTDLNVEITSRYLKKNWKLIQGKNHEFEIPQKLEPTIIKISKET